MAEKTGISWTGHTFNAWLGCTKVSPGCDNCYAEILDQRFGGGHWGHGNRPRIMSDANWRKVLSWHKKAEQAGIREKVFAGSLCDVFDRKSPEGQRDRLWALIRQTPCFDWQLLTKRAPNIERYLPEDWGEGYPNVWLGVSVENCEHGLKRMEILKTIPAAVRFLSIEPLLEDLGELDLQGIDWVIVGGESGAKNKIRSMQPAWVANIRQQCVAQQVPFFFKQWGGHLRDKGGCLLEGQEVKAFPQPQRGVR